jgi:PKD repeat protein
VAGEAVSFSVSAIDPEGSAVAPPIWNFGDGTAAGLVVTHIFREPGVYAVTVTATDAQGNQTTSAPTTITILGRLSQLKVGKIPVFTLKKLRKAKWKVRVNVTVNRPITVFVSLRLPKKGTIKTVSRNVATGTTPVIVQLPKSLQHKGTIQVRVTADSSALSALSRIVIK